MNMAEDTPTKEHMFAQGDPSSAGFAGQGGNFKMPSMEEVMKLLEQLDGISEEERENIRSNILLQQDNAAKMLQRQMQGHSVKDYGIFVAMVVLIALVFATFGYKLYKSLMAKEQKKKEKRGKQSKKQKQK